MCKKVFLAEGPPCIRRPGCSCITPKPSSSPLIRHTAAGCSSPPCSRHSSGSSASSWSALHRPHPPTQSSASAFDPPSSPSSASCPKPWRWRSWLTHGRSPVSARNFHTGIGLLDLPTILALSLVELLLTLTIRYLLSMHGHATWAPKPVRDVPVPVVLTEDNASVFIAFVFIATERQSLYFHA